MKKYKIDFNEVNKRALQKLESLLHDWLPAGSRIGGEYVCGGWDGAKGRSLSINLKTGKGGDFALGDLVGDPIGIYSKRFGVNRVAAALALADLLGMDRDNRIYGPLSKSLPSSTTRKDLQVIEDNKKQAKLKQIMAELVPLQGTPAQTYLMKRGIYGYNSDVFFFHPHKSGNGSLACIAKNEDGIIKAIQQVFITAEGYINHALKVKKRTNGFPGGNPVRIPRRHGVNADTPIIICEGPEDGITLANATGYEVWVTCGLSFMDKIPYLASKQFLIVRDNDAPNSAADLRMHKVLYNLLERGFKNLLCARPPEAIKDANELLQKLGMQAVQEMVQQAQPLKHYQHRNLKTMPHRVIDYNEYSLPPINEQSKTSIFKECALIQHTDFGNALRIQKRWAKVLRYVDGIGWSIYSQGKWDTDLAEYRVIKMATMTAVEIQQEIQYASEHMQEAIKKWSKKSQNGTQIRNALKMAQAYLAITASQLDNNPYFFNCANGVIDLKTGNLLPHKSSYLLTKQSNIAYEPNAQCPTWEKFLQQIFPENPEIIPFLQRAVGYSLTGDTCEQCMFILHGNGANGKSTFLDTLQGIMNDFWIKTKAEAFMERDRGSDASPFLAMLRGARFVTASETKADRSLDEAVVKEATGDSFITVRNLYQNPITFQPQFKLWLATNHKPEIRGTDEGIWRRLRLIPFKAQFFDEKDHNSHAPGPFKDKLLSIKLNSELPGILAWAVRGCLDWQKYGLQTPATIQQATQEYRSEMDIIGTFLEECCDLCPDHNTSCNEVYGIYKQWCEENGHYALSKNKLGRRIYERGFAKARSYKGDKAYQGIGIKQDLHRNKTNATSNGW